MKKEEEKEIQDRKNIVEYKISNDCCPDKDKN